MANLSSAKLLYWEHESSYGNRFLFFTFSVKHKDTHDSYLQAVHDTSSSLAIYRARVSFVHSIVRGLLFRYFPTISGSGVANRKGHSWSACINPLLLVNPPVIRWTRGRKRGRPRKGGNREGERERERGMKEELRSTRIANYLSKQAAVDTGGRSRWHRKLLRSSIARSRDPPGSRFRDPEKASVKGPWPSRKIPFRRRNNLFRFCDFIDSPA